MAEQARTTAAAALTERMRDLKKYKDKANKSTRLLKAKYETCEGAKEELMRQHYLYGEKAKIDITSEEMVAWLEEKLDPATDLLDEVFIMLEEAETAAEKTALDEIKEEKRANETDVANQQATFEEKLLRDQIETMMETVEEENKTRDDAIQVQSQLKEIDVVLGNLIKSWNISKSFCKVKAGRDAIFVKEEAVKKLVSEKRASAYTFISKLIPDESNNAVAKQENVAEKSSDQSKEFSIKHDRAKFPPFSGNPRAYARFKGDFNRIITKQCPDDISRAYLLKTQCLEGEPQTLVEAIEDLDEVWQRLDSKYGNVQRIVNLVLNEVKNLKIKYDDASLVTLVDTLEKGTQDLTLINARAEIATTNTVNVIETKLSKRILSKWYDKEGDQMKGGAEYFWISFRKFGNFQSKKLVRMFRKFRNLYSEEMFEFERKSTKRLFYHPRVTRSQSHTFRHTTALLPSQMAVYSFT